MANMKYRRCIKNIESDKFIVEVSEDGIKETSEKDEVKYFSIEKANKICSKLNKHRGKKIYIVLPYPYKHVPM